MTLKALKQYCISQNIPIISDNTTIFLQGFLSTHEIKNYGEIGTAQGYSTLIAAQVLTDDCRIQTWEISYPQYKQALIHFNQYGGKNICAYYANATQNNRKKFLSNKLDCLFLDAQKSTYHSIIESIRPRINHDGYIIVDDVIKFKSKTLPLYHWLDENRIFYTVYKIDEDDGVMVIKKTINHSSTRQTHNSIL